MKIKRISILFVAIILFAVGCFSYSAEVVPMPKLDYSSLNKYAIVSEEQMEQFGTNYVYGDVGVGYRVTTLPVITGEHKGTSALYNDSFYKAQKDAVYYYDQVKNMKATTLVTGNIGGNTFLPGIVSSEEKVKVNEMITLDGNGDKTSQFVFMVNGLEVSNKSEFRFINGASPENIYWLVNGSVIMNEESKIVGDIIAINEIELKRGSSCEGRLITISGAVKINASTIKPIVREIPTMELSKVIKLQIGSKEAISQNGIVILDVAPYIENGITYVPLSFVGKQLGGVTTYEKLKGKPAMITIEFERTKAVVTVGSTSVQLVKGIEYSTIKSQGKAVIKDGRVMVPFKLIADIYGAKTDFGMKNDNSGVEWVSFQ